MRVMVVGGGGREHALVWKISRNSSISKIYAVPGNAGVCGMAHCPSIDITDNAALARFAEDEQVDLTVVGPEAPLTNGIVDEFVAHGLRVFGPNKEAAQMEGSKKFAKSIMKKAGIVTAASDTFTDCNKALAYLEEVGAPIVVKADGLAAGKGVTVCENIKTAQAAVKECLIDKRFGDAGETVMIEEYLQGPELTVMALTDGETVLPMLPAQDHKPAFDGDAGPNTGGMGAYSPVPKVSQKTLDWIEDNVLKKTVAALRGEGVDYKGVLYAGLILTDDGPKVLEFNARFGDPEAQVVLPLLESDLVEIMLALTEGNLKEYKLNWSKKICVSVVMASGGYPGDYPTGKEITGLTNLGDIGGLLVFHAGTKLVDGKTVTAGGRVLNITGMGKDVHEARDKAYAAIERIKFDGAFYRTDIALKAIQ
ncbi:MAG: phosphoribosylamine--glycine ligase [Actinomycetota bacterium]